MCPTKDDLERRLLHDLKGYRGVMACAIYFMKNGEDSHHDAETLEEILGRNLKSIHLLLNSLRTTPLDYIALEQVKKDVTETMNLLYSIPPEILEKLQTSTQRKISQTVNLAKVLTK